MRILCAMDGSEWALRAGRWVAALPLMGQDEVVALTVVIPEDGTDGTAASRRSTAALTGTSAKVRTIVGKGHAADRILEVAGAEKADLIVVGSRGLTGLIHVLLGSVAERVARHAAGPVVVARGETPPRRILLGVDGSEGAERALHWLLSLPGVASAEVAVVTVLPFVEDLARAHRLQFPAASADRSVQAEVAAEIDAARRMVERKVAALGEAGISATAEVRHGEPAPELVEAAQSHQADLVVVGAHGLSAIERFFMGSVSERVLRLAHCSVAIVR